MTDKVQKIREEVEKLKSNLIYGACSSQIAMETRCKEEAYNEVLAILDTMQEEPKQCIYSKDNYTEEDRKVLCEGCEEKCKENDNSLTQESVSEELEEAADNALSNVLNTHEIVNVRSCLEMFKSGAKWQKAKDESITEDLGEYINELSKQFPEISFAKLSRIAVRVSRWQKTQDTKNKLPNVLNRTDLDEYAYQCAYDMSNDWAIDNPTWHDVEDACKLGAKWQKKQDQSTLPILE